MMSSSPIKKAIFPAGGLGTRFLPATKSIPKEMLPVVDKPLIQYAVEEAAEAGIEEFIFITGPGKSAIEDHFDRTPQAATYICQQEPLGLGHAVWCARHLIEDEPVAVLLADDLILSKNKGCLTEMIDAWTEGNMVACMEVPQADTSSYGIITPGATNGSLTEVIGLIEKPKPSDAPSRLAVVGRYIITPHVFDELARLEQGAGGEIQLTDSLARTIDTIPFSALSFNGTRYDCGSKIGFLKANIAFGLEREDLSDELSRWLKDFCL